MKKNVNNLENVEILKKYKDLSKALLIHSSKQNQEIFKFIEYINNTNKLISINAELIKEIIPAEDIFEVFNISDSRKCNDIYSSLFHLAYEKDNNIISEKMDNLLIDLEKECN